MFALVKKSIVPGGKYIRTWYHKAYPTDEIWREISKTATFDGVLNCLKKSGNLYDYLEIYDSLARERIFVELSNRLNISYEDIFIKWIRN